MNSLTEFFSSSWAHALGWTLLHSLWQGLIILGFSVILLRIIPGRFSNARYMIATACLLLILITSVVTFISLNSSVSPRAAIGAVTFVKAAALQATTHESGVGTIVDQLVYGFQPYIPFVITLWIIGTSLFSLRLAGSWWYISKLKKEANILNNEWSERVAALAQQLNISRIITLAESAHIHAPAVIGYIKPVILIPVGMFSGLSTEQVEAIFVHELTHIKRHDYLINVIQSLIEAVFFFNPFVWVISGVMRREREHCCDDAVLLHHGNAGAYARALAHLEEIKMTRAGLALSLAGNKNELLNRIKRIMEKSVKNYSGREKIVPALLLLAGFICASWITIGVNNEDRTVLSNKNETLQASDTTIKKNDGSATYSYKKITTIGPDGKPHEEVVESFDGDESLRPMISVAPVPMESFDLDIPMPEVAVPGFDMTFPTMPPMPDMDITLAPMPPMAAFDLHFNGRDTIPGFTYRSDRDWEAFGEEFEKKFKENFGDFYAKHQEQMDKMFEELEHNFENKFDENWTIKMEDRTRLLEDRAHLMEEHANKMKDRVKEMESRRDSWKQHEERVKEVEEKMKEWEKDHGQRMQEIEKQMKTFEENWKSFEAEAKKELIKDGYLTKEEDIRTFSWSDKGELEVNGKKIKESDAKKYDALQKKYHLGEEGSNFRYEN